jgi:hypothetical protein
MPINWAKAIDRTVDWMHRDSARANIRRHVKRLLRKYGYPPDLQDAAVQNVLQQAGHCRPNGQHKIAFTPSPDARKENGTSTLNHNEDLPASGAAGEGQADVACSTTLKQAWRRTE